MTLEEISREIERLLSEASGETVCVTYEWAFGWNHFIFEAKPA